MKSQKKDKNKIYHEKIFLGILIVGMLIVGILSAIYAKLINAGVWENGADAWIALWIGGLGVIATAELGYVAIWQNQQTKKLSDKMFEMEENGKHSLLFVKKRFDYQRVKLGKNFVANSKMAPVDYFIATVGEEEQDHIEKLTLYCLVDNLNLEDLTVRNIRFVGKKDAIRFTLMQGIDTSIVYDVDKKEYVVEIVFLSGRKIFDCIKSDEYYLEITFEHVNIFKIRDSRICEVNFYKAFAEADIDSFSAKKQSFDVYSVAYRRDKNNE